MSSFRLKKYRFVHVNGPGAGSLALAKENLVGGDKHLFFGL